MEKLTAARLPELLHYSPKKDFTRRVATGRHGCHRAGEVVGGPLKNGYWNIGVCGGRHLGHRLAWLYVKGEWPKGGLDHINGDKTDNRWANLRMATKSQNGANRGVQVNNGLKSVSWRSDICKWTSKIEVDGKNHHLGCFDTPERAWLAYVLAARKHFGDFARIEAGGVTFFQDREGDEDA